MYGPTEPPKPEPQPEPDDGGKGGEPTEGDDN